MYVHEPLIWIRELREREQDSKWLIELYQSAAKESRELTEVMTKHLKHFVIAAFFVKLILVQVRLAEKQLLAQAEEMKNTIAVMQTQLDELKSRPTGDELIQDLQQKLDAQAAENTDIMSELEVISKAYEDMQNQNARLLRLLSEKDDHNTHLMTEVWMVFNAKIHISYVLYKLVTFPNEMGDDIC